MRRQRPSAERFLNSENFELKFQAVTTDWKYGRGKDAKGYRTGGGWIAQEYYRGIANMKPFPLKVVIDGIMEQ